MAQHRGDYTPLRPFFLERLMAFLFERVVFAPAPGLRLTPARLNPTLPFHPVQHRIQHPVRPLDFFGRQPLNLLDERIPVTLAFGQQAQDQRLRGSRHKFFRNHRATIHRNTMYVNGNPIFFSWHGHLKDFSHNLLMPPVFVSLMPLCAAQRRFRGAVLCGLLLAAPSPANSSGAGQDWPNVGGDKGCQRYSPLQQITRRNVANLQVAWTYHSGDAGNGTTIECTPIVIEGVMYLTTVRSKVVALDAGTGRQRWQYDPYANVMITQPRVSGGVNRGVAYWSDGKVARILVGVADGRLISLDTKTGQPDPAFGKEGIVDLREGMETDLNGVNYGPTSAPAVYRNIVVLGFSCPEGGRPAPGDPRAFDVRTGKELSRFHTIPPPGEFGHETWEGDSWQHAGAANNWSGCTVDEKRGWVFIGTGSASPDF